MPPLPLFSRHFLRRYADVFAMPRHDDAIFSLMAPDAYSMPFALLLMFIFFAAADISPPPSPLFR